MRRRLAVWGWLIRDVDSEPYPTTTIEGYIRGDLIPGFRETSHRTLVFRGNTPKRRLGTQKGPPKTIGQAIEKIVATFRGGRKSSLVARE